ncbi:capsid protein [Miresoil virus 141]|uniref:Capsid protein n=1 Tax=Miresoil virus 141 TaxID=2911453 RepID=A0A9E8YWY8_9VIRU|nr:capsid protein [Miresoil virus 141]
MTRRQQSTRKYSKRSLLGATMVAGAKMAKHFKPIPKYGKVKVLANTKRRKHLEERKITNSDGSYTLSFFRRTQKLRRLGKLVKLLPAPNYFTVNTANRLNGAVGLQKPFTMLYTYNQADITSMFQALLPIATTVQYKTARVLFESCYATCEFANMDESTLNYTIYDLLARKDIAVGEGSAGDSVATNTYDPILAWDDGTKAETNGTANISLIADQKPQMSVEFNTWWKIKGVSHGFLRPGQTHKHITNYKLNKVLNREVLSGAGTGALGGITHAIMIVFRGSIANATSKLGNTVSYTAPAVDYITNVSYKTKFVQDNYTSASVTNVLPSSFATGPNLIDLASGLVITDASAQLIKQIFLNIITITITNTLTLPFPFLQQILIHNEKTPTILFQALPDDILNFQLKYNSIYNSVILQQSKSLEGRKKNGQQKRDPHVVWEFLLRTVCFFYRVVLFNSNYIPSIFTHLFKIRFPISQYNQMWTIKHQHITFIFRTKNQSIFNIFKTSITQMTTTFSGQITNYYINFFPTFQSFCQ